MVIGNIFTGLTSVLIIITFLLGLLVLLTDSGWKKLNNVNFSLFAFAVVLMQASSILTLVLNNHEIILFFGKVSYAAGALVVFALLSFVLLFPNPISRKNWIVKLIKYFALLLTLVLVALSFSGSFIKDIVFENQSLVFNYGNYLLYYLILLCVNVLVIIISIILGYKNSDNSSRQRIKSLFIGVLISLTIIVFTDVIIPTFFNSNMQFISNFGFISSVFVVGFAAYAIVKNELFDIRVILTETATVLVTLAMLVQTFLSQNINEGLLNVIILILVAYGGYLIIKSVQKEIKQKEKLQELTTQLAQANVHLKELDEMKTEFVSLASHELLTPVSAIEGYLSMLLDEKMARVDDPKALRYLDNVYKSAKRLARLIADMLNISRIEEGRLLVEKKDISVTDMITQVIDEVKFKSEERKQKVVFEGGVFNSYADPDKVKEVVVNLVGNSIKYSKGPGTITIGIQKVPTTQIAARWQQIEDSVKDEPFEDQESIKSTVDPHLRELVGDEQLLISVKDDGIGIPVDELTKLFKKFHRVGNYSTQESQGTGLGLYISRALTELQHGRIWADSEGEGKGSTFSFTLPDLSVKEKIIDVEKEAPQDKEKLKPLAKPMKAAEEI